MKAHVVCGNAGAGKSTFAVRLCAELGAVLIDIDTVTERLAKLALSCRGMDQNDRDSPEYKALLREPVYETLFDVAVANLPHLPCVIVAPFTLERRQADWPLRLARRLGAEVEIYLVHCSDEQRRSRIEQRGNPRDQGKLVDFSSYAGLGVDPGPLPFAHRRIDTSGR